MLKKIRLLFAFMFLFLLGCKQETKPQEKELIRPVMVEEVTLSDNHQARSFAGLAKSSDKEQLSFQVNGRIKTLGVQVGSQVRKGQVIAQLDNNDYSLRVSQAHASLQVANTQVNNAKAQYERIRNLYESDSVSRNDLDSSYAAYQISKATKTQAQEELKLATNQSNYTQLRVSKNGCAIAAIQAHENQNVAAGQAIVELECGDKLEIEVYIPETIIGFIKSGTKAKVKFSSLPDTFLNATVSEVGISTAGGITYPVILILEDKNEKLRAGMTADVFFSIQIQDDSTQLVVPFFSVAADQNGNFVYLFEATGARNGIVKRQPIKVGKTSPKGIIVLEGLSPGQKIITAGINQIHEGMKVKLLATPVLRQQ
jgi:RND family efflux transporter MFP subunit